MYFIKMCEKSRICNIKKQSEYNPRRNYAESCLNGAAYEEWERFGQETQCQESLTI